MKENEFLDGVSNIEADVVERFVLIDDKLQNNTNKSKSKGLWLRIGAVAACLALILGAVIVAPMLWDDSPDVTTEAPTTEGTFNTEAPTTEKTYRIYLGASASAEIVDIKNSSDRVSFEDASQKTFSFSRDTIFDNSDLVGTTRKLNIGDKSYSLTYSKSYRTKLYSSEKFKPYAEFITFKADDLSVYYRADDGALIFFSDLNVGNLTVSGELTEDGAKALALDTIISLYGESVAREYILDDIVFTDTPLTKAYTVVYTKYVYDTPTNDKIQLSYNMQGDLVTVNAKLLGVYDDATDHLSQKQIDEAKAVLNEALADDWSILTVTLVIDSLGDYYLKAQAAKTTEVGISAAELFIDIK